MTTIANFFEVISETFAAEECLWTPNWWYLILQKCLDHPMLKECTPTDTLNFENWKNAVLRILRLWSAYFLPWQITSLDELKIKTGPMLACTYKWSLSPQTFETVLICWSTCVVADPVSAEKCMDLSLRKIISMCSIPALSHPESVSVVGNEIYQQETGTSSGQKRSVLDYTGDEHHSANSQIQTGYTSSSISFFARGEKQAENTYSAMVPIKDYYIVVSINLYS
jgi:hypothetical protein